MNHKNIYKLLTHNKYTMNKWLEILLGLILLVVPIAIILPGMPLASWGIAALEFLKGGLVWLVILIGFFLIMLGISDLKEN